MILKIFFVSELVSKPVFWGQPPQFVSIKHISIEKNIKWTCFCSLFPGRRKDSPSFPEDAPLYGRMTVEERMLTKLTILSCFMSCNKVTMVPKVNSQKLMHLTLTSEPKFTTHGLTIKRKWDRIPGSIYIVTAYAGIHFLTRITGAISQQQTVSLTPKFWHQIWLLTGL